MIVPVLPGEICVFCGWVVVGPRAFRLWSMGIGSGGGEAEGLVRRIYAYMYILYYNVCSWASALAAARFVGVL